MKNHPRKRNLLQSSMSFDKPSQHPSQRKNSQIKDLVIELQTKLEMETLKRKQIEEKYEDLKRVCVQRQQEFRGIINSNFQLKETDNQKKDLYQNITESFLSMDEGNNNLIEKQADHISKLMKNRINQILRVLESETKKSKKLSNQTYEVMKREIQKVLEIGNKIDLENISMKEKARSTEQTNRILHEEKQLLIDEVVHKKKIIAKLYSQLKIYKSKVKQHHLSPSFLQIESSVINSQINPEQEPNDNQCRFLGEPQIISPIKRNSQSELKHKNIQISQSVPQNNTVRMAWKVSRNQNYRYAPKSLSTKKGSLLKKQLSGFDPKNSTEAKDKKYNQGRALEYIKQSLQRQKKKSTRLSKMVNQLQNRDKYTNEAIHQALALHKKEIDGLKDKCRQSRQLELNKVRNVQKLIEQLVSLKKRLLAFEQPAYGCGWGKGLEESIKGLKQYQGQLDLNNQIL